MSDTLSTLNWLVEAGADEAVAEEPVNRLVAKAAVQPKLTPRSGGNFPTTASPCLRPRP